MFISSYRHGDLPQSEDAVLQHFLPKQQKPQVTGPVSTVTQCFYKQLLVWSPISVARCHLWLQVLVQRWVAQRLPGLKWEVAQNIPCEAQVLPGAENAQNKVKHGVSHPTLPKPRIADPLTSQLHLTEIKKTTLEKMLVVETAPVGSRSTRLFDPSLHCSCNMPLEYKSMGGTGTGEPGEVGTLS